MARAIGELETITHAFRPPSSERASRLRRLQARTIDASHVAVPPVGPSGFHIDLFSWRGGTTGDFGGLVHEFDDFDHALWWAERCFGENCRLRIDYTNDVAFRWALEAGWERGTPNEWLASGSPVMTLALAPTTVRYFTNYERVTRPIAFREFVHEALRA
jgi:hypothetical protein